MRTPFKCPICNGTGRVPCGFYDAIGVDHWVTSDATPETCKACHGTGIVWGEDITEVDFEEPQSNQGYFRLNDDENTSIT